MKIHKISVKSFCSGFEHVEQVFPKNEEEGFMGSLRLITYMLVCKIWVGGVSCTF